MYSALGDVGPSEGFRQPSKRIRITSFLKDSRYETLKGQRTFSRWEKTIKNSHLAGRNLHLKSERPCRECLRPLEAPPPAYREGQYLGPTGNQLVVDVDLGAWT